MTKVLEKLDTTIQERIKESSKNSHTAKLVKKGPEKCAEKFGEEAIELIVASVKKKKKDVISEAADTLYHMCVLLRSCLLYTSPSPRDYAASRMPSSA